jgi:hypothetical protein
MPPGSKDWYEDEWLIHGGRRAERAWQEIHDRWNYKRQDPPIPDFMAMFDEMVAEQERQKQCNQ